jgi:hypothetical protein
MADMAPPPAMELVTNGGFEGSTSGPWVEAGEGVTHYRGGNQPRSGNNYVAFSSTDSAAGSLEQQIALPFAASRRVALTFWLNVTSDEGAQTALDFFHVELRNPAGNVLATLATYSNRDKGTIGVYAMKGPFDLGAHGGQAVRLHFRYTTNQTNFTTFRIDDVSVK